MAEAAAMWVADNALAIMIATTVASTAYTVYQQKKLKDQAGGGDRKQTFRSPNPACQMVFGTAEVSGPIVFVEEVGDPDKKGHGEELHVVIPLACHPCEKILSLKIGDRKLRHHPSRAREIGADQCFWLYDEEEYLGYPQIGQIWAEVAVYLGGQTTAPQELLALPSWTADMIGRDSTYLHVKMVSDFEQWPSGFENISAVLRGYNRVYDPRTNTRSWTENAVLNARAYIEDFVGINSNNIPNATWIAAANECAETVTHIVTTDDGSQKTITEPRYRACAALDADTAPADVLDKFAAAMGGRIVDHGGVWSVQTGAYYGPATFEIGPDDIIDDPELIPHGDRDSRINTVTAQYIDEKHSYTVVDMPQVQNAAALAEDGEAKTSDAADLDWVPSATQAQRLANIMINTSRGHTLSLTCKIRCFPCVYGRVVRVRLPALRLNGEEFRVTSWEFDGQTVKLELRLDAPAMYNNPTGLREVATPNTPTLPNPYKVAPVTQLTWADAQPDGEYQGVLSWEHASPSSRYRIRVIDVAAKEEIVRWDDYAATRLPIQSLIKGKAYTALVAAKNATGKHSHDESINFQPTIDRPTGAAGGFYEHRFIASETKPDLPTTASPALWTLDWPDSKLAIWRILAFKNAADELIKIGDRPAGWSGPVRVRGAVSEDGIDIDDIKGDIEELLNEATQEFPTETEVTDIITDILDPEDPRVGLVNEVNTILEQHAEDERQHSQITAVNRAIVAETETRTQALKRVSAKFGDVEASITEAEQAIATERKARTESVKQLTATDAATYNELQRVEADVTGNASTIRSIQGRVENPYNGLSAAFSLSQQANTTAQGAATSSTHVKNMVEDKKTGLAATAQLALAAQQAVDGVQKSLATLKASLDKIDDGPMTAAETQLLLGAIRDDVNKNISAIATLNSTVTGPDGSASSMLELVTQINNDLQIYRAQAQLSVDANGNVALIKMGATADETEIKFQAGTVVWLDDAGRPVVYWDTQRKTYHFDGTFEATNIIGDLAAGAVLEVNRGASGTPLHDTPVTTVIDVDIEAEAFEREAIISALTIEIGRVTSYADISIWRNGRQLSSRRSSGGVVALSATLPANRAHNLQIKVRGKFNSSAHDPQGQGASVYAKGPALLSLQRSSSKITINPV